MSGRNSSAELNKVFAQRVKEVQQEEKREAKEKNEKEAKLEEARFMLFGEKGRSPKSKVTEAPSIASKKKTTCCF